MNKEAKAIGAKNTNFDNPNGLPDVKHYTTAYDMALMSREAMNSEIFRNIVKTKSITFKPSEAYPYERYFVNTNKFLTSNEKINYKGQQIDINYDIIDGIKTGYTDDAGRCLLSSGVKNNMRLISSVFKSNGNNLYLDSRTLLDYGFDNFRSTTIVNKEDYIKNKKVLFSKQKELIYEPEYSYKLVLPKGTKENEYTTKIKLDNINLPIRKGDKVGTLEVYKENKVNHAINLIAKDNVNSVFASVTENKAIMSAIKIGIVALSFIIIFIIFIVARKKTRRRRKNTKNIYSNKSRRFKKGKR
jgi:D-alanyl-D-alanine carboxypeptidase (penicillin-binding protein 5/6)